MHNDQSNESQSTTCCVVGGGPAGVVLSLLLARQQVPVTLLEAHQDFERDFRGDTIHPSTLELVDRLGLSEKLHALPHRKLRTLTIASQAGRTRIIDFGRLHSRFPYIMVMPQARFLQFLVDEAAKFPSFRLLRGANVNELVDESGVVRGVRFQAAGSGRHEVRAELTVGADGRFSRVRKLAGFEPVRSAPPMDVLWLRVPRRATDTEDDFSGVIHIGHGHFAVVFDRPGDEWQIGFAILKGSYAELKAQGIEALQRALAELVPALADRVSLIADFKELTVLSVDVSRVPCWHKPGLLLIGDAAHVMSPVAGIGIQYAVQDAVEAANMLGAPLRAGRVDDALLAAVQARREPAVRRAQRLQGFLQKRIVAQALQSDRPFRLPLPMRVLLSIPVLRNIPARIIGRGFNSARLPDTLQSL